jgi:hypothetical protein
MKLEMRLVILWLAFFEKGLQVWSFELMVLLVEYGLGQGREGAGTGLVHGGDLVVLNGDAVVLNW